MSAAPYSNISRCISCTRNICLQIDWSTFVLHHIAFLFSSESLKWSAYDLDVGAKELEEKMCWEYVKDNLEECLSKVWKEAKWVISTCSPRRPGL